jgi:hypothetical protein
MHLTAGDAPVAVKRRAIKPVNRVMNFPVLQNFQREKQFQTQVLNSMSATSVF